MISHAKELMPVLVWHPAISKRVNRARGVPTALEEGDANFLLTHTDHRL